MIVGVINRRETVVVGGAGFESISWTQKCEIMLTLELEPGKIGEPYTQSFQAIKFSIWTH
jgi:hypothetical protein